MSALYNPAQGGPNTGYGGGNPNADTAGCTKWAGATAPAEQCGSSNPAWISHVLPGVTWIKKLVQRATHINLMTNHRLSQILYYIKLIRQTPTPDDGITIELLSGGKEIH